MKILLLLAVLISANVFATSSRLKVTRGKLHKGGYVKLESQNIASSTTQTKILINYEIYKKNLIPKQFNKYLTGTYAQNIPSVFQYNSGYLDLQKSRKKLVRQAVLYHKGRVNVGRYYQAHKVLLVADNGKSELTFYYHPKAPGLGWFKVHLKIKKIPVLKTYQLTAVE
jgi:hypothetical protein